MSLTRTRLRAQVVYGGLGTAVQNGAAVVQDADGDRRLLFLGDAEEAARRWPDAEESDAGFALSPAPVNAHLHLDLTTMPHVEDDYEAFVRAVIRHGRDGRRGAEAARQGLAELAAAGTTTFGDIVADEATMRLLLETPGLQGVAYWEVFAPDPAQADAVFDATVARLRAFRALERQGGLRVGVSPHAPHTVSAPLLVRLARLASANDLPMQIHVAESPSETRLHRLGDGPLRELMGPLLGDFRPSGRSPVGYLEQLGVLEARPTLVHAVHVDEDDVRAVQRAGSAVVHCPRSNRSLRTGRFPWELYARHGVSVAFGTDSRGSSPSLDVQEEVAAAARWHGRHANPGALVRAAVKGGHRALGLTPPKLGRGDPADRLVAWRVQVPSSVSDV
ncbi:MAG: amidohydrolase family protein [Trueperaceae bacterium]|nr:amidohydrolase family protein [Trueperaceae bacterium]